MIGDCRLRSRAGFLALFALAGCGSAIEQCANPDSVVSTRDLQLALPDGCRVLDTDSTGSITMACDDGRVGYAISASIFNEW